MDLKEKITATSFFAIAIAASYLFGYWGAFNVNVFELGGIVDIAKLAAFPLITGLAFLLAASVVNDIFVGDRLPSGGGSDTPIGRLGFKHWRSLVAALIATIVLIAVFAPESGKWHLVAFLFSYLSIPLSHSAAVIAYFPDAKIRSRVLYFGLLVPAIAFACGRSDAYLVKSGHASRIIDVVRSKIELKDSIGKRVAYLGRIGEIDVFFESLTGNVVLSKQRNDTPLFIIPQYEASLQGEGNVGDKAVLRQSALPSVNASAPTPAPKL